MLACCLALALAAAARAAKDDLELVTRASGAAGVKGNGVFSSQQSVSADGRLVAFTSFSTNLHPDAPDAFGDIFLRDLATDTTTLISRAAGASGVKGNGQSAETAMSADGRVVAYVSRSTNLHPDDTDNVTDVFVRDLATHTTTLASRATGASGVKGNVVSIVPALSADGRFVAFESFSQNLHPDDTDAIGDVYVRDLQRNTTTLVSRATGPIGVKGEQRSTVPAISADGRFVAFMSGARNLDPADTDFFWDVYVRDLQANTTTLVSRATGAAGAKAIGTQPLDWTTISADGRFVAFASNAAVLHSDPTDRTLDVFVRDLQANTTTLVSRATGPGGAKGNGDSTAPDVSADGRVIAFSSQASNLHPDDTDATVDVFARHLLTGATMLVSRGAGATGGKGNGFSGFPQISANGQHVVFQSDASNLHPDDPDANDDIFSRDIGPPPQPPPPPAGPSPPSGPGPSPSAAMRLRALGVSVFGRSGSEARCRMRSGRIRSCTVQLLFGERVLAEGRARGGAGARAVTVRLRLTRFGRALLARRVGGVRARVRARGVMPSGGARRASARTRALLQVERFGTPAGSWEPGGAVLTARGRSFVRGLRGRLIAVASLRCDGHNANVRPGRVDASRLSLARAAAMCRTLTALGVTARPRLAGHGDAQPIASNATESGRANNRRVEVTLTHRPRRL